MGYNLQPCPQCGHLTYRAALTGAGWGLTREVVLDGELLCYQLLDGGQVVATSESMVLHDCRMQDHSGVGGDS